MMSTKHISPFFQMEKLRYRENSEFSEALQSSPCHSQELNTGILRPSPGFSNPRENTTFLHTLLAAFSSSSFPLLCCSSKQQTWVKRMPTGTINPYRDQTHFTFVPCSKEPEAPVTLWGYCSKISQQGMVDKRAKWRVPRELEQGRSHEATRGCHGSPWGSVLLHVPWFTQGSTHHSPRA